MDLNQVIKEMVREEVASVLSVNGNGRDADPVMITLADAAKICGCSRSVIEALHREHKQNGFPSVQLGPRTINVDKRRLSQWLTEGGLELAK